MSDKTLQVDDKVYFKKDILRGLGTVIAISLTGKTVKVKWPDPYNIREKATYYKFKNLLNEQACEIEWKGQLI